MKLKTGKKSGLKYFDYEDIQSWNPCYDSSKFISKSWRGTAIDILNLDNVPFQDRLWCVLRTELVSDRVMRLFAVWSYRQTLKFLPNQDDRSINAANVAERYANGEATQEELSAAESAASSAANAASSAAYSAAWSAANSAANAAYSAAWSSAWSAANAASSAAESAAWSAQKDKLIEMIKAEGKELLKKKRK